MTFLNGGHSKSLLSSGPLYTLSVALTSKGMNHKKVTNGLRPYLFEKLLLGFILQQNGSVGRQKKNKKTAS